MTTTAALLAARADDDNPAVLHSVATLLARRLDLSSAATRFGFVCLDRLERGLHTQRLK